MSKAVDSTEWTRLYWTVMAIVVWLLLSNLFGCAPEPATYVKYPEDYVARYWFLLAIPTALLFWATCKVKATLLKSFLALLTLISFCLLMVPYMLMFALWVMTELIP